MARLLIARYSAARTSSAIFASDTCAFSTNVRPTKRLAVGFLASEGDPVTPHETAGAVVEKIKTQLGSASVVGMRFGLDPESGKAGLKSWLQQAVDDAE